MTKTPKLPFYRKTKVRQSTNNILIAEGADEGGPDPDEEAAAAAKKGLDQSSGVGEQAPLREFISNDLEKNAERFMGNHICTSKYTIITFLPLNLWL